MEKLPPRRREDRRHKVAKPPTSSHAAHEGRKNMALVRRGIASAFLASASLISLGLVAEPALAQTQGAAAASGPSAVETVTVTATRRAEDKQKVGVSLTAITEAD